MQKWEYIQITNEWTGSYYRINMINGQQVSWDRPMPNFSSHLDKLGEEGWELVSNGYGVLFLKRPKPGSE